ncbi:hypothetical protein PR048_033633 [Dryococelus australis]|uniref:DDE-1 domain-containing protein n=1 Tax=Dryococelus australis TaxID=614101 RepID=A0ABQ9G0U1_9NEOP|nr:hypothetical protein PR048_033633 [Dryococelus australis]
MKLTFEITEQNNFSTRLNEDKYESGNEWFERRPEATSSARAAGFNKVVVNKFFGCAGKSSRPGENYSIQNSKASSWWHDCLRKEAKCDRCVHHECCWIIYIPPMLIHARKIMKDSSVFGAPSGTILGCQDKDWVTADVFTEWMSHFIRYVKPSVTEKVVLILDGHSSHTRSLH